MRDNRSRWRRSREKGKESVVVIDLGLLPRDDANLRKHLSSREHQRRDELMPRTANQPAKKKSEDGVKLDEKSKRASRKLIGLISRTPRVKCSLCSFAATLFCIFFILTRMLDPTARHLVVVHRSRSIVLASLSHR